MPKGDREHDPLIAYTNPYLESQNLEAMREGQMDNISVGSGGDQEAIDVTKDKGTAGAAQTVSETIAEAKKVTGEVLATQDDEQPWYLAPLVVAAFLFFDVSKIIAEKLAQHGSTINGSLLNNYIIMLNVILAFSMTISFMGVKGGFAKMFDWKLLLGYSTPAAFFAVSQLFNLLQNNFIDASSRKVFSQLRILLTAMLGKFIMGTGYTTLQWLMIISITVAVFQFLFLTSAEPNPLGGDFKTIIGLMFSVISNVCAVLGSLLGEKHMKATKKLPFYLQKFQFESWTLLFAIFGIFVTNPLGGMMADSVGMIMQQPGAATSYKQIYTLRSPQTKTANVFGEVLKASFFTVNDALSNLDFEAEIFDPATGTLRKERIPNKFNMKSWTSHEDKRTDGLDLIARPDAEVGYAATSMTRHELYNMIESYAAIQAKRSNVKSGEDLSTWKLRDDFINPKNIDSMKAKVMGHHATRYRQMNFAGMLMDTAFTNKMPFAMAPSFSLKGDLAAAFSLHMGKNSPTEVVDKNNPSSKVVVDKFHPLQLFVRDAPAYAARVLELTKSSRLVDPVTKEKGDEDPEKIATFSQDPATYLRVDGKGVAPGHEMDRLERFSRVFDQFYKSMTKAAGDKDVANKDKLTRGTDFQFNAEDMSNDSMWNHVVEYKMGLNYVRDLPAKKISSSPVGASLEMKFVRELTSVLKKARAGAERDMVDSFKVRDSKSFTLKYKLENLLDYGVVAGERQLTAGAGFRVKGTLQGMSGALGPLTDLSNFKESKGQVGVFQSGKATRDPKTGKDSRAKEVSGKVEEKSCTSLDQRLFFGAADIDNKVEDANSRPKFKIFGEKQTFDYLKQMEVADFWSHVGKVPANAAMVDLHQLTEKEAAANGFEVLAKQHYVNPNVQFGSGFYQKTNEEDHKDPFSWAIFHGFTLNPTPFPFMLRLAVAFAIFSNAGQSWMSAYLSKVLSSLWKNICAAVALALVIFFEKGLLSTDQEWQDTKMMNVFLGSFGIMLTVFIFQLAPKAPKPEARDIETGHGRRH